MLVAFSMLPRLAMVFINIYGTHLRHVRYEHLCAHPEASFSAEAWATRLLTASIWLTWATVTGYVIFTFLLYLSLRLAAASDRQGMWQKGVQWTAHKLALFGILGKSDVRAIQYVPLNAAECVNFPQRRLCMFKWCDNVLSRFKTLGS